MCGIEKAGFEQNKEAMETAVREDLMLHAYMLTQSGIPMLYSGDELGQVNDYSYKEDPAKCADSRYIHRGKLQWSLQRIRIIPQLFREVSSRLLIGWKRSADRK